MDDEQDTQPVDRELLLVAAEISLTAFTGVIIDHQTRELMLSALRLGFAIGHNDNPAKYVPAVAVEAAARAKVEALELRAQERQRVGQMHVTEAIGRGIGLGMVGGGGRLW